MSLAAAIVLELIGLRHASNIFWVVMVLADAGRWTFGYRDKKLSDQEKTHLLEELAATRERQSATDHLVGKLRLDQAERSTIFNITRFAGFIDSHAKASVDIMYPQGNGEAEDLAQKIEIAIVLAGWTIAATRHPIPLGKSDLESPISQIGAASTGVTILIGKEYTPEDLTAFWALWDAFKDQDASQV